MVNIVTFGSCLSRLTAAQLATIFSYKVLNHVAQIRSDNFVNYYIKKNQQMIPYSYYANLIYQEGREAEANKILQTQYPENIGKYHLPNTVDVFENLQQEKVDIFLLDNWCDITYKLLCPTRLDEFQDSSVFLVGHSYTNLLDYFQFSDYLTAEASVNNWQLIIEFLLQYQPHAQIFFLCFPYCTSQDKPDRYQRAKKFADLFLNLAIAKQIITIPPFYVKPTLTKNWSHFDSHIYASLAGFIHHTLLLGDRCS